MKKKLLLITTGGTIASKNTGNGLAPSVSPEDILGSMTDLIGFCTIDCMELLRLDSTNMQPEHWLLMAQTIKEHYHDYDGFVITHGTDTMAYTSSALSYLIQNPDKPIVLTGSQKPLMDEVTDAKKNLLDSIRFACEDGVRGVFLVFSGSAIVGTRARKTRSKSYYAFSSINYPEVASIDGGRVLRYVVPEPSMAPLKFYDKMVPEVFLLKLIPGMDPGVLDYVADHYKAVVIETYGVGGLPFPEHRNFMDRMQTLADKGCIVVISTQVAMEGSDLATYEVGHEAMERYDLLQAYDMTTEAAVTKLMWLLGLDLPREEFKKAFYTPVAFDTVPFSILK